MFEVLKSLGWIALLIGLVIACCLIKTYEWIFVAMTFFTIFAISFYEHYENVLLTFWGIITISASAWSSYEMILTIDFKQPFLMSFYWNTLGYFSLSILLLFIGISLFFKVVKK